MVGTYPRARRLTLVAVVVALWIAGTFPSTIFAVGESLSVADAATTTRATASTTTATLSTASPDTATPPATTTPTATPGPAVTPPATTTAQDTAVAASSTGTPQTTAEATAATGGAGAKDPTSEPPAAPVTARTVVARETAAPVAARTVVARETVAPVTPLLPPPRPACHEPRAQIPCLQLTAAPLVGRRDAMPRPSDMFQMTGAMQLAGAATPNAGPARGGQPRPAAQSVAPEPAAQPAVFRLQTRALTRDGSSSRITRMLALILPLGPSDGSRDNGPPPPPALIVALVLVAVLAAGSRVLHDPALRGPTGFVRVVPRPG